MRLRQRISLGQAAANSGLEVQAANAVEAGQARISAALLQRLADALDVPVSDVLREADHLDREKH
ncbi:MAG: helix-turn-helix transcriptional regulator [Pseudomonadota bacterium]